MVMETSLI